MDLETIYREVEDVKHILETLNDNQKRDHEILLEHDKILVRGNGVPSLQENVRNLAKAMNDFIDDILRDWKEEDEKSHNIPKLCERCEANHGDMSCEEFKKLKKFVKRKTG